MSKTSSRLRNRVIVGLLAGLFAGIFGIFLPLPIGLGLYLILTTVLGLIFGLLLGPRIQTTGSGLVWGEAYGLVWWLIGPLTLFPLLSGQGLRWSIPAAREVFPLLLVLVVGYGALLGLVYYGLALGLNQVIPTGLDGSLQKRKQSGPSGQAIVPPLVQAVIIGGLGGLLGSWVFAWGVETEIFFPLVAGLMGSDSMVVGRLLHYAIGTTIGITFGLLFYRDVLGAGSSLVWGLNYGLIWWVIGPLSLLPIGLRIMGLPDWTVPAAQAVFAPLVAHLLFGSIVGLFYALVNKLWNILFVDSDPLNRTAEGAGPRSVRGLLMGLAAGATGGLLFTIVMAGIGALPQVASLVGAQSTFSGLVVHLIIAIIIGGSYGLLFQREAFSYGPGLAWGLVYGLIWWLLGALTLFPILLRQPADWSLLTVVILYPALIGHLLYGAGLGLFFQFLARRYDKRFYGRSWSGVVREARPNYEEQNARGKPASALWAVMLILGVMLPLLLSA